MVLPRCSSVWSTATRRCMTPSTPAAARRAPGASTSPAGRGDQVVPASPDRAYRRPATPAGAGASGGPRRVAGRGHQHRPRQAGRGRGGVRRGVRRQDGRAPSQVCWRCRSCPPSTTWCCVTTGVAAPDPATSPDVRRGRTARARRRGSSRRCSSYVACDLNAKTALPRTCTSTSARPTTAWSGSPSAPAATCAASPTSELLIAVRLLTGARRGTVHQPVTEGKLRSVAARRCEDDGVVRVAGRRPPPPQVISAAAAGQWQARSGRKGSCSFGVRRRRPRTSRPRRGGARGRGRQGAGGELPERVGFVRVRERGRRDSAARLRRDAGGEYHAATPNAGV